MAITAPLISSVLLTALLCGQRSAPTPRVETSGGIAWFGTWTQGLAEARRTNRPILLISAAPHCSQIPGMW